MSDGSGDVISVDYPEIAISDFNSRVRDTIAFTRNYADSFMERFTESINNIEAVLENYDPEILQNEIDVPSVDGPAFPIKPIWAALNLNGNWPSTVLQEPSLMSFGEFDFDFVVPTPPNEVSEAFTFTPAEYTSDMWTTLFSRTHTAILDGNYGISSVAHAAILAKEKEARRLSQDDEYRAGLNAVGVKGFNLNGGKIAAFLGRFHAEVLKRDQDALNNIVIEDFKITNENEKFYFSLALDMEKTFQALFTSIQDRSLEAAKAVKEYIYKFLEVNLRLYLGKLEGEKIKFDAMRSKIEAISARNSSETQVFLARAQVLESKINAITAENKGKVDARLGEVSTYSSEIEAVRSAYEVLLKEIELNQNAVKMEIDRDLKVEDLKLTAYTSKATLTTSTSNDLAKMAIQGIASSLGAVNTNIGENYSAQQGESVSTQFSGSLVEQYYHKAEE